MRIKLVLAALAAAVAMGFAAIGACSTGSATVLTSRLPWHITYEGFEGALPT